ncbi:MAG: hypothetical protein RSB45_01265 [Bacilli bacterium]
MKKLKYLSMTVAALCIALVGTVTVEAKTFDHADIDAASSEVIGGETVYNNIYIIGNHIFIKSLTVDNIMTAAKTIPDGEPNIIYFRSTTKEWSNSVTGTPITSAPKSFEIKFQDEVSVDDPVLAENLKAKEDEVKTLTPTHYTDFSAVTKAMGLKADTDDLRTAKLLALTEAVSNLVFANQANLTIIEEEVRSLVKADYTVASFNEFMKSYAEVAKMPATTYKEIETKLTLIEALKNGLAKITLVKTDLTAEINAEFSDGATRKTYKLTENQYVKATWDFYVKSITDAILVETNATLQSEIENARTSIKNAIKALEFANKADLVEAKKNTGLTLTDYTDATAKVLTDLTSVDTDEDTFAKINTKINAIKAAKAGLLTKVAVKDYTEASKAGSAIKNTDSSYTTVSFQALTDALALTHTTNAEYVTATAAINTAIKGLVFTGQADLTTELNLHKALIEGNYTKLSWNIYSSTYTTIMATELKTNADVTERTTALTNARASLVKIDNGHAALTTYIDSLYSGTRTTLKIVNNPVIYTATSYKAYTDAIDAAKVVETNQASKLASEIDAAKAAIVEAEKALVFDNLDELATAKDIKALVEKEYTVASFKALTDAISGGDETTFAGITAKITAITDAKGKLVFTNKADLVEAKKNTGLTLADYTDASQKVLTDLTSVDTNEDTFAKIDTKIKAINAAKAALITKVTDAAITAEIAKIKDNESTHYTNYADYKTLKESVPANQAEAEKKLADLKAYKLVFANQAELNTLNQTIADKKYVAADYTEVTFTPLTTALALPETTFDEIEAKITALNNAVTGLVFADSAALTTIETTVNTLNEATYTAESWAAITAAKALKADTNQLVIDKTTALTKANAALITKVTDEAIKAEIAKVTDTDPTHYTEATWKAYKLVADIKPTDQKTAEKKLADLKTAVAALTFANQKELNDLIAPSRLVEADYTAASWTVYNTAITKVSPNTYADNATKIADIKDAESKLELINLKPYNDLLTELGKLVETDYTADSWVLYQAALADAKSLPIGTNTLYANKTKALNDAKGKLVVKTLVLTELDKLIRAQYTTDKMDELVETNNPAKYTVETYDAYTTALAHAKGISATHTNMLQSQIDAEIVVLNTAITGLVLVK